MYYGEKLNSISHLVGASLALIGLGALLTIGFQSRDVWIIASFSVFGYFPIVQSYFSKEKGRRCDF